MKRHQQALQKTFVSTSSVTPYPTVVSSPSSPVPFDLLWPPSQLEPVTYDSSLANWIGDDDEWLRWLEKQHEDVPEPDDSSRPNELVPISND
jgi:hypothetical protein